MSRVWELEALAEQLRGLRAAGEARRVVLANGCFDLFHAGHVRYLEDARTRGDFLVVAVNSDDSVRALKGRNRPFQPLADRLEIVAALRCVDAVTSFGERDLGATLRALAPDVHAKGSDYTSETVPEKAVDEELGIEIAICGGPKVRSTSDLARR